MIQNNPCPTPSGTSPRHGRRVPCGDGKARAERDSGAGERAIPDVQGRTDVRGIPLQWAGVTGLRYPATAVDPAGVERPTLAELELAVAVPADAKGTHMSRFVQIVQEGTRRLAPGALVDVARELRARLDSDAARIAVRYPLFFERAAPVTGEVGLLDVDCGIVVELDGPHVDLVQRVDVTVTSLCPCSKEISDYGAHNQRGIVTIEVRAAYPSSDDAGAASVSREPASIPVGELIAAAEDAASCRVYPVLKRPDERFVTMQAYENPVFVEDMVRGVAERLMADERVAWFRVHARNEESIHGHDAFASTEWTRPD